MTRSPALLLGLLVAGCGNQHLVGTTDTPGYLSTDSCTKHADIKTCISDTAAGCAWVDAPSCPAGVKCPTGLCYAPDPCLTITDIKTCIAESGCAWSDAETLCPLGANCKSGGYCHPKDPSGGTCSCVTPLGCPMDPNKPCPPPECDCSGGGSGGGTCTCAAPECKPGEACPPADCRCDDGGGSGCVDDGTCTCACPACGPGETCPPCECSCGSGGPVTAPNPDGTTASPTPAGTGMSGSPGDPCSAHVDSATCSNDVLNKCSWIALGAPCMAGDPMCKSGVCQQPPAPGGCGCACPSCPPNTACAPCQCSCTDPTGGCKPPEPLPPPPGGGTTPCPAIGCEINCPNGYQKDANGCPSCACL